MGRDTRVEVGERKMELLSTPWSYSTAWPGQYLKPDVGHGLEGSMLPKAGQSLPT